MGNKNNRGNKPSANARAPDNTKAPGIVKAHVSATAVSNPPAITNRPWKAPAPFNLKTGPVSLPRAKRNRPPKLVSSEISFFRARSATADVTISTEGVTLNKYKITTFTYSNGRIRSEVSYPFQAGKYNFIEHFANGMSSENRITFLSEHWIEIILRAEADAHATPTILAQLEKLGPDFAEHVQNLVLKVELPPLSETLKSNQGMIFSSPGYRAIQDVVHGVNGYPSLSAVNVVLSMPHSFSEGMHDLQLIYALPFYPLVFTSWTFKFQVPGIHHPKLAPKEDLKRLNQLNRNQQKATPTNSAKDWVR